MSDDLISRQAAIDDAHRQIWYRLNPNMKERIDTWLVNLPAVQPKQKTGRWISNQHTDTVLCSECKKCYGDESKFCPNCGTKMESDNNDS